MPVHVSQVGLYLLRIRQAWLSVHLVYTRGWRQSGEQGSSSSLCTADYSSLLSHFLPAPFARWGFGTGVGHSYNFCWLFTVYSLCKSLSVSTLWKRCYLYLLFRVVGNGASGVKLLAGIVVHIFNSST